MKYHLMTAGLIVTAVAFELAGFGNAGSDLGATLFIFGASCELLFWSRLGFAKKMRRRESASN